MDKSTILTQLDQRIKSTEDDIAFSIRCLERAKRNDPEWVPIWYGTIMKQQCRLGVLQNLQITVGDMDSFALEVWIEFFVLCKGA